jgi:hypothetical protein
MLLLIYTCMHLRALPNLMECQHLAHPSPRLPLHGHIKFTMGYTNLIYISRHLYTIYNFQIHMSHYNFLIHQIQCSDKLQENGKEMAPCCWYILTGLQEQGIFRRITSKNFRHKLKTQFLRVTKMRKSSRQPQKALITDMSLNY